MITLTKDEKKWLEKSAKARFHMGEILEEMNKRVRSYLGLGIYSEAQTQTMQDFQGLFDPAEIVPNKNWDRSVESPAFIKQEVKKGRTK